MSKAIGQTNPDLRALQAIERANAACVARICEISVVVFGILATLCLFSPLVFGTASTGFYVSCAVGAASFIGFIVSGSVLCQKQDIPRIQSSRIKAPQTNKSRLNRDYWNNPRTYGSSSTSSSTGTPKPSFLTRSDPLKTNLEIPRELKSPFPQVLWGIVKQIGPYQLKFHYFTDQIEHPTVFTIDALSIEKQIDTINEKLKDQYAQFQKTLTQLGVAKEIADKCSLLLEKAITDLQNLLNEKKVAFKNLEGIEHNRDQKDKLSDGFGLLSFRPLEEAMYEIEMHLGIQHALKEHILKLIDGIVQDQDRDELQKQAEICRTYFNFRSNNPNPFREENETDMLTKLFRIVYWGEDFIEGAETPIGGIAAAEEVRCIPLVKLKDRKISEKDNIIIGTFEGQEWVILSTCAGGGRYRGHYTNYVYNGNAGYSYFDNLLKQRPHTPSKTLFGEISEKDPPKKEGQSHGILVSLFGGNKNEEEKVEDEEEKNIRKMQIDDSVSYDRGCVIMELNAFEKHKDQLELPKVIPSFYNNNCYLAVALVRLATYHQAASLVSNPV